eukprot:TRINITY_DN61743_c0_g1_i1.p1 TRINITY_DN61743_c0_g1~~TRINITY_DN61743_c0_g1_i1.p1  ORF type:complete len:767 (-),score=149.70 TRINITY_DN61743_c0_g1_i1:175-2475(-)
MLNTTDPDAVPIGEGWTRHNQEILVHAPSQVFFAQRGEHRGKYLVRSDDGGGWTVCPAPHVSTDCPIEVRAAAASILRAAPSQQGGIGRSGDAERKMERAVVIAEMPKTARLALRFPLGFLDTPAAAYAVFSGLGGNVGAAHWCASQFHQRLLPAIAKRIHGWWDSEAEMPEELLYRGSHVGSMATLLREQLQTLDRDLLAGPHGFGGCDVAVAVLIGESLVAAAAGQASVTMLFDDAEPVSLLPVQEIDPEAFFGQLRPGHASPEGALLGKDGLLRRAKSCFSEKTGSGAGCKTLPSDGGVEITGGVPASSPSTNDVERILRAPDAFAVLGLAEGGPESSADARSAYKRLALRVHPDKVRDCDPAEAKAAFGRVETAARVVESLAEKDVKACRQLHRILRYDPFTLRGAASILEVDVEAEEKQIRNAVEKLKQTILKAQTEEGIVEARRGLEFCRVAEATFSISRQGGSPGQAGERLLAEGVKAESFGALGMRHLRGLSCGSGTRTPGLEVRAAAWRIGEPLRVALCAGATAELTISALEESARICQWQPKAAALQWAKSALALPRRESDSSASAICVCIRDRSDEDGAEADDLSNRPAKRQKTVSGPRSVRVRHLLLRCAEAGKSLPDDPQARRPKANAASRRVAALASAGSTAAAASTGAVVVRTPAEAEAELVDHLRRLLPRTSESDDSDVKQKMLAFRKLCHEKSECDSAENAGQLCGDLGWISRGQAEPTFEQAAFTLRVGEISDVVSTSRGVHLVQRLA